jgi:beta-lactamase regulating signal transducer with metallopeptidase domain
LQIPLVATESAAVRILGDGVVCVWLLGAIWMLLRWGWRMHLIYLLLCNACRPTHREQKRLQRLLPVTTRCGGEKILWSTNVTGPCVVPAWPGARILLPATARNWQDDTLAHVLHHEWEHVRRGDVWWRLMAEMVRALWWFHPLAHGLVRSWMEQCEHVCDTAVVRGGASPGGYDRSLLELAGDRVPALPLAFAASSKSRLRLRVEAVFRGDSSGASHRAVMGWLALVTLILGGGMAALLRVSSPPQHSAGPTAALREEARVRLSANPFPGNSE